MGTGAGVKSMAAGASSSSPSSSSMSLFSESASSSKRAVTCGNTSMSESTSLCSYIRSSLLDSFPGFPCNLAVSNKSSKAIVSESTADVLVLVLVDLSPVEVVAVGELGAVPVGLDPALALAAAAAALAVITDLGGFMC